MFQRIENKFPRDKISLLFLKFNFLKMAITDLMAVPFNNLGLLSPIFGVLKTISSWIIQMLISFMPLHNCVSSFLDGMDLDVDLLVNCSLDIGTFIPFFTPFILGTKMIVFVIKMLKMVLGPFLPNIS